MTTNILTRDSISKAQDVKTEIVPVPEWGGDVIIKMMTGKVREHFERYIQKNGDSAEPRLRAFLAALVLVDENGAFLYDASQAGELMELEKKSAAALMRIWDAASKMNMLGGQEDIDTATKN